MLRRRWLAEELARLVAEERRRNRAIVLRVRLGIDPKALSVLILGRNYVDVAGWAEPERYCAALSELLSELNEDDMLRAIKSSKHAKLN